jgi:hypothetical protein
MPPSALPAAPGQHALAACQLLSQSARPAEILLARGPLQVTTALHDLTLDAREWVLVGFPLEPDIPPDGAMIVYRLPPQPEVVGTGEHHAPSPSG